jgi:hypothetical protein
LIIKDSRNIDGNSWNFGTELGKISFWTSDTTGSGEQSISSIVSYNSRIGTLGKPTGGLAFNIAQYNAPETTRVVFTQYGTYGFNIGLTNPSATMQIKSIGNTSATTALLIQNSAGTELLKVTDNGNVGI